MADITLEQLLASGAHFGHQTSRWNPKMRRYILTAKNGIHLINLHETLRCVNEAEQKLCEVAGEGGAVLFVGTKPQAKDIVREAAEECKQFHVSLRWLGGMLTNFATIQKSLKKVEDTDRMEQDGTFGILPKKEVNILKKKREKILNVLAGVREMKELPGAVVIVDIIKEHIALAEAHRLGIPVVAIVDTNTDPSKVDFPIPANDDSLKTIVIILRALSKAMAATPVRAIRKESREDSFEGKKRVVRRKVIKTIVKRKVLKGSTEAAEAKAAGDAPAAPVV